MLIWRIVSLAFLRWVGNDWGWKLHMDWERVIREVTSVGGEMASHG